MTDLTGDEQPSGRLFLTLQQGERLRCIALSPTFFFALVTLAGLLLASALAQTAFTLLRANEKLQSDADPSTASLRISHLQSEVERLTSRNAIASDLLEKKVRDLAARQAELEAQAMALQALGPADRNLNRPIPEDSPEPPPVRLKRLDGAMNLLRDHNAAALAELGARKRGEAARMEAALRAIGLNPGALRPAPPAAAGGPFTPLNERFHDKSFAAALSDAEPALARHAQLMDVLASVPLRAPVAQPYEASSAFGARMDPINGRAGWHSGIDLRHDAGGDVLATASGLIVHAGWNGAYGQMIEIDHGSGFVTRYGHLSRLIGREGQRVDSGALIGASGSTGRSTGAHLHYEVRVNGEAVDPSRYLRAGEMIANLLDTRSRPRDLAYMASR